MSIEKEQKELRAKGLYDQAFFESLFDYKDEKKQQEIEERIISAGWFYLNMKKSNQAPITDGEQNKLLQDVEKKSRKLEETLIKLSGSIMATSKLYVVVKEMAEGEPDLFETHFAKSLLVSSHPDASYDSPNIYRLVNMISECAEKAQTFKLGREGGQIGAILDAWLLNMRRLWTDCELGSNFTLGEYFKDQKMYKNQILAEKLHTIIHRIDDDITLADIFTAFRRSNI